MRDRSPCQHDAPNTGPEQQPPANWPVKASEHGIGPQGGGERRDQAAILGVWDDVGRWFHQIRSG